MSGLPVLTSSSATLRILLEIAWGADLTDLTAASWTWTDITGRIVFDGSTNPITLTLGRSDESTVTNPATMTCRLLNGDGYFSQGGISANYPNVRRSTPVRLRVSTDSGSTWKVKFQGNVVGFSPVFDDVSKWVTVSLLAAGPLRKFNQGTLASESVMHRYMTSFAAESVTDYWPCEDDKLATQFAEAIGTLGPMDYFWATSVSGNIGVLGDPSTWQLAAATGVPASAALPTYPSSSTNAAGQMQPPFPPAGTKQVSGIFDPVAGSAATELFSMMAPTRTGTAEVPRSIYQDIAADSNAFMTVQLLSNALSFQIWTQSVTQSLILGGTGNPSFTGITTTPFRWRVAWTGTSFTFAYLPMGATTEISATGSFTLDPLTAYTYACFGTITFSGGKIQASGGSGGHFAYHSAAASLNASATYVNSHLTETSSQRVLRVANEAGVALTLLDSASTETSANGLDGLGYQYQDTPSNILREAEQTGQGLLVDGLNNGLTYITRGLRSSQPATLTLDATVGGVQVIDPVDDEQHVFNDVTVTQRSGSSAKYADVSGPVGINAVGDYQDSLTINPSSDAPLDELAQWIVHIGTPSGYRFPQVTFDLHFQPSLIAAWLTMIPTGRLDVVNLGVIRPQLIGPQQPLRLIVEGWTETITQFEWTVHANTSPWEAWNVGKMAAATGTTGDSVMRRDTDGSATNAAYAAGVTSIAVKLTASGKPLWTTAADDFPFLADVGGNVVQVTGISGGASPQTFTLASPGLPYAVAINAPVRLWNPPVLGV